MFRAFEFTQKDIPRIALNINSIFLIFYASFLGLFIMTEFPNAPIGSYLYDLFLINYISLLFIERSNYGQELIEIGIRILDFKS